MDTISAGESRVNYVVRSVPAKGEILGINSVAANIQCGRHNSVLPIPDTKATLFLGTTNDVRVGLDDKSLSPPRPLNRHHRLDRCLLWVICGGARPSPTRQVKLNKRTFSPRTARLSFCSEVKTCENFPRANLFNWLWFP